MGGGGEWFTLIMTSIFCYCTDRNFKAGAIMCAIPTFLQLLTGIPTIYNAPTAGKQKYDFIPRMGPERVGYYPKKAHDANFTGCGPSRSPCARFSSSSSSR